jgi:hypothetical protein
VQDRAQVMAFFQPAAASLIDAVPHEVGLLGINCDLYVDLSRPKEMHLYGRPTNPAIDC